MASLATNQYWILGLILLLPLLGAAFNGILGHRLPKQIVWTVACGSVGLAFILALFTVSAMWQGSKLVESHPPQSVEGEQEHGKAEVEERAFIRSPKLTWTAFQWITSGDWSEGEDGYVPTAQFQALDSQVMEACWPRTSGKTDWADKKLSLTDCLFGVYTPTIQTPEGTVAEQGGIGGVRARLKRDTHQFGAVHVAAKFRVDALSAVMLLIVLGVGFLIHVYSVGYMRHDRSKARFFAYLNLFIFAMLTLILADNLIVMFVGWEGVGLCSYLLIGYYYEGNDNADAGKKAFIVNRVGDFAFMVGVLALFWAFGTVEFDGLEAAVSSGVTPELAGLITLACVLIFGGCTGKSAQIPLYTWLPDAMAGPTPVSALIHAATMVTAGVYLVARLSFLFVLSPTAMAVVAVVGAVTALFAATIALTQTDIKKVLAYSTVSQLGYMFLAVGVGAWWVGIFHLMTHAFFKALLFLGSGSVIDAMHHEQDIRVMGGLRKLMPVTAITFLIGCLAIAGVPLLAGFFSKDQILWYAWFNQPGGWSAGLSWFLWGVGTLTAGLTAFYMFRLYFVTFEGECRASDEVKHHVTESPTSMTVPLAVLALLAVVGGYVGLPHVLSGGNHTLETLQLWLTYVVDSPVRHKALSHSTEVGWEWGLMTVSVLVALAGISLAYVMYVRKPELAARMADRFRGPHRVLMNKYYVDELYYATVVKGVLWLGRFAHGVVDVVLIDVLLIRGAAWLYELGGNALKYFQNGDLQRYAAYIVFGIVAIVYLVLL